MEHFLTVRSEAEQDISEVFSYYEQKRIGLGHDFLLCVEEAMSRATKSPLIYKPVYKQLRKIVVKRFPFRVFYLVQQNNVIVTAVFHARKSPDKWNERQY